MSPVADRRGPRTVNSSEINLLIECFHRVTTEGTSPWSCKLLNDKCLRLLVIAEFAAVATKHGFATRSGLSDASESGIAPRLRRRRDCEAPPRRRELRRPFRPPGDPVRRLPRCLLGTGRRRARRGRSRPPNPLPSSRTQKVIESDSSSDRAPASTDLLACRTALRSRFSQARTRRCPSASQSSIRPPDSIETRTPRFTASGSTERMASRSTSRGRTGSNSSGAPASRRAASRRSSARI